MYGYVIAVMITLAHTWYHLLLDLISAVVSFEKQHRDFM